MVKLSIPYLLEKDANHKKKIGLLAQDIEKIFPRIIFNTKSRKPTTSSLVNSNKLTKAYQNDLAVLINAIKEQQSVLEI